MALGFLRHLFLIFPVAYAPAGKHVLPEYSSEWSAGMEPYYPVNNEQNNTLYEKYRKLAEKEPNVIFGGRLGNYKYYDMDKVIEAALDMSQKELL